MTWRCVSTITITQFGVNCGIPSKPEEPQFAQFGAKFGCCDPRDAVERLKKWRVRAVGYWMSPCKWGVFVDDYFWGLEVVSRVLNSGTSPGCLILDSAQCRPVSHHAVPFVYHCSTEPLHHTIALHCTTPYYCLHHTIACTIPYCTIPYCTIPYCTIVTILYLVPKLFDEVEMISKNEKIASLYSEKLNKAN